METAYHHSLGLFCIVTGFLDVSSLAMKYFRCNKMEIPLFDYNTRVFLYKKKMQIIDRRREPLLITRTCLYGNHIPKSVKYVNRPYYTKLVSVHT